jgi:iron complex outermembrane receptor protein
MNPKSFQLLLVLLLCVGVTQAFAQGTLRGTVTDESTKDVLAGTNILLSSADGSVSRGTNSGIDGTFTFSNLPAGTYTARISYVGYNDKTVTGISVVSGQTATLDIALTPGVSLNPVVVSASKAQEKVTEAPASIQVITARDIRNVSTATATDYVKGLTAVDVAQQGVASQTVVTRGFNNIFSGSLLVLTDNRITHIPSLRANALHFIPQTNDDIESVEMVLGPGAALYGPNTNSGVMHLLTKSPLTSAGTIVSVFGGNQSFMKAQFRTAHAFSDRVGLKISAQYVSAREFKMDTTNTYRRDEVVARTNFRDGPDGFAGTLDDGDILSPIGRRIGVRDYDIQKIGVDGRLDYVMSDDMSLILNAGFNQSNNIDLTGIGAGQAVNWTYSYYQARVLYRNWFFQTFLNASNSGDTYIIETGEAIVDKSKLLVSQLQHSADWRKFNFVYGLDYISTMPETEGTVNGQYEDKDTYSEFGGYLQTKYRLMDNLDLLASFRVDQHSELNDPVFSPRAAIVYRPIQNHNFRLTYNRSFSTPSSNNMYLDLLARSVPIFAGYNLNVRAQGIPKTGFSFARAPNGTPLWQSNVIPALTNQQLGFIDANHWAVIKNLISVQTGSAALGQNAPQPGTGPFTNVGLMMINPLNGTVVSDVTDIKRIEPTIYNTFEAGYKGIFNNKLLLSLDAYYTIAENFVGPLLVEAPTVNMVAPQLIQYLTQYFNAAGVPDAAATALQLGTGLARVPLGVVSPVEAFDRNAVMLTYRNFGQINYFGVDFGFEYLMNSQFRLMGNYSFVSQDKWLDLDGNSDFDIYLNAPTNKFMLGVGYDNRDLGFDAGLKFRYVSGFEIESGIYSTVNPVTNQHEALDDYYNIDLNMGYDIKQVRGLRASLTVNNLTNNAKPQFAGTPDIGLFAIGGLTYSF